MKPRAVAIIHRGLCEKAKCEYLDKINYNDPCVACPNGHFAQYILRGCSPGLGDKIAAVAEPIARTIDKVFGTKIKGCGGCGKMRKRLNAGIPISQALKKRIKGE